MKSFYKVPFYKKLLSYLVPLTIKKGTEEDGSLIQVLLSSNTWQLASATALYSDGTKYRPFRLAFKQLGAAYLKGIKHCLVLGTGLGSIVQILHSKYKADPDFYLVEKEELILHWAVELLRGQGIGRIHPVCADAGDYLEQDNKKYNLICVDVFKDRIVPDYFTSEVFFENCRGLLLSGGVWIMNYIIYDDKEWTGFISRVKKVFPAVKVLENDQNRILISKYES